MSRSKYNSRNPLSPNELQQITLVSKKSLRIITPKEKTTQREKQMTHRPFILFSVDQPDRSYAYNEVCRTTVRNRLDQLGIGYIEGVVRDDGANSVVFHVTGNINSLQKIVEGICEDYGQDYYVYVDYKRRVDAMNSNGTFYKNLGFWRQQIIEWWKDNENIEGNWILLEGEFYVYTKDNPQKTFQTFNGINQQ